MRHKLPSVNDKPVYIYFIQAFGVQELKRIKIGMSDNPGNRLMELQVGSPVKLKMLGTVRCRSRAHAASVERLAHNLFHKQRRRGEWFHLSRNHLAQIKSLIERAAEAEESASGSSLPGAPTSSAYTML